MKIYVVCFEEDYHEAEVYFVKKENAVEYAKNIARRWMEEDPTYYNDYTVEEFLDCDILYIKEIKTED